MNFSQNKTSKGNLDADPIRPTNCNYLNKGNFARTSNFSVHPQAVKIQKLEVIHFIKTSNFSVGSTVLTLELWLIVGPTVLTLE